VNSRLSRATIAAVAATFALALSGCTEVNADKANKVIGDGADVIKDQKTVPATDGVVASVKEQGKKDAGIAAANKLGYTPVAYVVDAKQNVELIMKICKDGLKGEACLNKVPSSFEKPDVILHLKGEPANDVVEPNGHYALRYPGIGGRHGGITCEAKPGDTASGLTEGVVGDFVAIGSAVDKQFAQAASGATQAINLASGDFNCTAAAV
jgi:hypothetical protein